MLANRAEVLALYKLDEDGIMFSTSTLIGVIIFLLLLIKAIVVFVRQTTKLNNARISLRQVIEQMTLKQKIDLCLVCPPFENILPVVLTSGEKANFFLPKGIDDRRALEEQIRVEFLDSSEGAKMEITAHLNWAISVKLITLKEVENLFDTFLVNYGVDAGFDC